MKYYVPKTNHNNFWEKDNLIKTNFENIEGDSAYFWIESAYINIERMIINNIVLI